VFSPAPREPAYLLRTNPDGSRQISWRVWVLVWVTPVVFGLAAGWLALETLWTQSTMAVTEAEVVHVYAWDSTNPLDEGPKVYSPRYRYIWSDGTPTEATAGVSSSLWNFEIGSRHPIRYNPDRKDDVVLIGASEWMVARVIAIIGLCVVPLSILASLLLLGWQRRGKQGPT
jgi:hypothetical protein